MRLVSRLLRGDWLASVLTGVFFATVVGRIDKPHPILAVALLGGVYALAVHGLMSFFGVRRWGWVVAGILCGPLPAALLVSSDPAKGDERGGAILVALILGILLGLVRWAREARREASAGAGPRPDSVGE